MRRRLVVLTCAVLLLGATCAQAAVAHVASGNGQCTNGSNGTLNMSASGACTGSIVTITFTYTPTTASNAVVIMTSCGDSAGTPSAVSLTATGWTLTQVGSITGSTTSGFAALFKAYAPNTSAATFTATWTATTCGTFFNDLIDEFSGADPTNFVDVSNSKTNTTGGCAVSGAGNGVTPTVNNDGIWFGCNDSVSAVGGAYTAGGNDGAGDWSEWKLLAGGSGTEQFAALTTSGAWVLFGIGVKPAAAGISGCKNGLLLFGVGCEDAP